MAYAQKRGKTWRVLYKRPPGTQPEWGSESGFPTKNTALKWGRDQEAAIAAGRWVDPDKARVPFGEFARTFMKKRVKRGRTMDKRWDLLETYILPQWETTPLIAFNWFDVDTWQQTLPCDDVTRGHAVSLMSTVLTAAVDARRIMVNPLFGRRRTKSLTPVGPKRPKKSDEEKWAPPETVIRLAERLGPATGLHVLTTAFTGLRWGEGAGLHRDNVLQTRRQAHDGGWFQCPVVRVVPDVGELSEVELRDDDGKKLGTVLRLEHPKSAKGVRDIDVPPFLARLLRYHLADWPHPFVFCTPSGTFWRRGNWGKVLRPAADGRPERKKRQGTSYRPAWEPIMPGLDMRALRHTHDTYQDQIGVKPSLAFEQAGHQRPGIKAVYQHPTAEMRIERLDGLEEIFWRAMGNLGLRTLWGRVDLVKKVPPGSGSTKYLPRDHLAIMASEIGPAQRRAG